MSPEGPRAAATERTRGTTIGDRVGITGLDGALVGVVVGVVVGILSSSVWVTVIAALLAAIPVVLWADRFWALFDRETAKNDVVDKAAARGVDEG